MLLRSAARDPNPPRGQYHPADEELFGLGGSFTFDGSTWFKKGSYAFYPAYFVHGTNVHVRGGYELYVRISDTNKLWWEECPKSNTPYLLEGHVSGENFVQLASVNEVQPGTVSCDVPGLIARPLQIHNETGKGSTLIEFSNSDAGIVLEAPNLLEVFTLSGVYKMANSPEMRAHSYMCDASNLASLRIHCKTAGAVMVSHGGEMRISHA